MYESIWHLGDGALETEERVQPLVEAIAREPGFTPVDYDLNQKEQWREFDRRRTVVDALTQRTQLLRIRGDAEGSIAMVALGKRGEHPTAVVRQPGAPDLESIVDTWDGLAAEVDLEVAFVTTEAIRDEMERAGIDWSESELSPALVVGWPGHRAPRWLEEFAAGGEGPGGRSPVTADERESCTVLWLARGGEIEGDDHRDLLRRVVARAR